MKLGEHVCCWRQQTLVFNDPATFPPAAFRRRCDSFFGASLRLNKHTHTHTVPVRSTPSGWVWNGPRPLYRSFTVRFESNYCLWKGRTQSRGTCVSWSAPLIIWMNTWTELMNSKHPPMELWPGFVYVLIRLMLYMFTRLLRLLSISALKRLTERNMNSFNGLLMFSLWRSWSLGSPHITAEIQKQTGAHTHTQALTWGVVWSLNGEQKSAENVGGGGVIAEKWSAMSGGGTTGAFSSPAANPESIPQL